jgi:hypothetical protein
MKTIYLEITDKMNCARHINPTQARPLTYRGQCSHTCKVPQEW